MNKTCGLMLNNNMNEKITRGNTITDIYIDKNINKRNNILIISDGKYNERDFLFEFLLDEKRNLLNIYADRTPFLDYAIKIDDIFSGRIDKILKNNSLLVNIGDYGFACVDPGNKELQYFDKKSKKKGPHQGDEIIFKIKSERQKSKYPMGEVCTVDNLESFALFDKIQSGDMHYIHRINRNLNSIGRVITDDINIYNELKNIYYEDSSLNIELYSDNDFSLYKLYSLTSKLDNASAHSVKLKSGAEIVFNHTEAFEVIDVNSGRSSRKNADSVDDYFFNINMEALLEVSKQIKIRNLSGIILIDLINLKNKKRYDELLSYMKMQFLENNTITNVVDITSLGIMEITREKIETPLRQQLTGKE